MKRANLIFKHCASRIHLPKLAFCFAILMALNLSTLPTVDAQRHGGSGRGMGTSGGSHMSHISGGTHMSRSSGRMINSRIFTGNLFPGIIMAADTTDIGALLAGDIPSGLSGVIITGAYHPMHSGFTSMVPIIMTAMAFILNKKTISTKWSLHPLASR